MNLKFVFVERRIKKGILGLSWPPWSIILRRRFFSSRITGDGAGKSVLARVRRRDG